MIKKLINTLCLCMTAAATTAAQDMATFADSIRRAYHIPELSYAVVSADSILEMHALGYKKINSDRKADINELFRLGANTKAITAFIAAQLVKEGKISWNTNLFDLYPELKSHSKPAYNNLTLLNLLTFRAPLSHYTYTDKYPTREQIRGNDAEQRYHFIQWVLRQKPMAGSDGIYYSNPAYVIAGLMLERASGKDYKQLVNDLGTQLGIHFYFGQPNNLDTLQPWGHDSHLKPEPPGENYKLNWLLPAGNITVSLPDYAQFICLQLKGAAGRSTLLTSEEFNFLLSGRKRFAAGWFCDTDGKGQICAHNTGNPGTFLSNVFLYTDAGMAYIVYANAQTDEAEEGINILTDALTSKYNH